jgi:hypothetical protein
LHFDEGMPDKPGGKAFPKGIDIEAKLQKLKSEWIELTQMCPEASTNMQRRKPWSKW